jgi:hypothetical protein
VRFRIVAALRRHEHTRIVPVGLLAQAFGNAKPVSTPIRVKVH